MSEYSPKTILLATDGSEGAERVTRAAIDLSKRTGARLGSGVRWGSSWGQRRSWCTPTRACRRTLRRCPETTESSTRRWSRGTSGAPSRPSRRVPRSLRKPAGCDLGFDSWRGSAPRRSRRSPTKAMERDSSWSEAGGLARADAPGQRVDQGPDGREGAGARLPAPRERRRRQTPMNCKRRLGDHLREDEIPYRTQHHPRAITAQEVAATEHVPGRMFAKTVMVSTDGGAMRAWPTKSASSRRSPTARSGRCRRWGTSTASRLRRRDPGKRRDDSVQGWHPHGYHERCLRGLRTTGRVHRSRLRRSPERIGRAVGTGEPTRK
jgi:hypothetical protein